MHLGWWFRCIVRATVLTLGLGLIAGGGTASGLVLPTADPALASQTALPGSSGLPSTSALPVDPQKLIGSTAPVPVSTQPGPTGPSGPAGAAASPTTADPQATLSRAHKDSLQSLGRGVRNFNPGAGASGSHGSDPGIRGTRHVAGSRGRKDRLHRGHGSSGAHLSLFHPSRFDHLGPILPLPDQASRGGLLGGFASSATGRADWAPPLLTIMLLIGLGGFLRVATSRRRHA